MGSASVIVIVVGTLITGAANSLFTKYQDNQCVRHCNNPDVTKHRNFEQPALQSLQMFVGEFCILLVYYLMYRTNLFRSKKDYTPIGDEDQLDEDTLISVFENVQLAIPAICDLCATTLFNIGLVYVPVSIYQMTRGAVVLFVAIMSVLFLKRRISKLEWIALAFVTIGVGVVGVSGSSSHSDESAEATKESAALVWFGIALILFATIIQALQFVVEEHILSKKAIRPMKLVYCEGFYGIVTISVVLVILNYVLGAVQSPDKFIDSPFNIGEAYSQFVHNKEIFSTSILIMISIAGFNFFGITITHLLSATSRSTVDTCRTLIVWALAIFMGWEKFKLLQFAGFVILVFGTLCFNGVIKPEEWLWIPKSLKTEASPRLLEEIEEPIERF
ncbi:UDP-galactose transporter [Suhomyces tanzawaensis NRRL Y-17324]|uniref:UDP-galactose transporter n=1 Tax=Suhomyces tanzawaensis NRRL Y-17324 TaxID=984487 RepID=A0A1E4SEY0_9ASCO|nr:UDP-galactose transporter [Suhomyces tanzawaensis NRRL Y-17324]ODV78026.1 UDP-galactose transporter [Suhomyces tanzawaensis NRRL Y-17324]